MGPWIRTGGLVAAWLSLAAHAAHAAPVTGVVFADRDGDGARSAGDPPIGGAVVVWEDAVFASTGSDGAFTLEAPAAGQVWVRAPDGYSPRPVWTTVPAAGATGVELGLTPRPVALPLTFVHVADLHLGAIDGYDLEVPLARATSGSPPPHFVVATGDLTQSADPDQFRALRRAIAGIDVPFVPVLGNHDWYDDGAAYRAELGPPTYSFDAGDVHFIVLHGNAPVARRLEFVARDLATTPPRAMVAAFLHYPVTLPYDRELHDGLVAAGVTHIFTGHAHALRATTFPGVVDHTVQPLGMGGMQPVPAGYQTVTIVDGQVHTTPGFDVVAPVLEILSPRPAPCVPGRSISLIVAAELGPGDEVVTARVDGGAELALTRLGGWDHVAELDVGPGPHRLEVSARATSGGAAARTIASTFCVVDGEARAGPGTAWPQLQGGPEHLGATAATIRPPLAPLWARAVGGHLRGAPALAGGRLFVPIEDHGTAAAGGVVALDAATGEVAWRARVGRSVESPVAVAGDLVIAAAVDGVVRAFDVATGAVRWEVDLGDGLPPQARGLHAGPTVSRGVVYAGHLYRFVALDAATGALAWEVRPSDATFAWPGQSTVAAAGDVVVGLHGFGHEGAVGFDRASGVEVWRFVDPATAGMQAPPLIDGPRVVLSGGDGTVIALDARDGSEAWRRRLFDDGFDYGLWLRAAAAAGPGRYFVATQRGAIHALRAADGRLLWSHTPGRGTGPLRTTHYRAAADGFTASPVVTGELVWVGSDDGTLAALDAATGAVAWSIELGAPILANLVPSVADRSILYVATWDGTVRALVETDAPPPAPTGCGCHGAGGRGAWLAVALALAFACAGRWRARRWRARGV